MLNADVKNYLNETRIWTLCTVDGDNKPHAIPCAFHAVMPDDTLVFARVFMQDTVAFVAENPAACVTAYQVKPGEKPTGYRIEGTAKYVTEGPAVDAMRAAVEKMGMPFGGGVIAVVPEKTVYVGPGPNCRKVID